MKLGTRWVFCFEDAVGLRQMHRKREKGLCFFFRVSPKFIRNRRSNPPSIGLVDSWNHRHRLAFVFRHRVFHVYRVFFSNHSFPATKGKRRKKKKSIWFFFSFKNGPERGKVVGRWPPLGSRRYGNETRSNNINNNNNNNNNNNSNSNSNNGQSKEKSGNVAGSFPFGGRSTVETIAPVSNGGANTFFLNRSLSFLDFNPLPPPPPPKLCEWANKANALCRCSGASVSFPWNWDRWN